MQAIVAGAKFVTRTLSVFRQHRGPVAAAAETVSMATETSASVRIVPFRTSNLH